MPGEDRRYRDWIRRLRESNLMAFRNGITIKLLAPLALAGCTSIQYAQGLAFNIDRAREIKPGMSQEEVVSMLGNPYWTSETFEGDLKYNYAFQMLAGSTNSREGSAIRTGGKATVVFKGGRVVSCEYEVFGGENFKRLILKTGNQ